MAIILGGYYTGADIMQAAAINRSNTVPSGMQWFINS